MNRERRGACGRPRDWTEGRDGGITEAEWGVSWVCAAALAISGATDDVLSSAGVLWRVILIARKQTHSSNSESQTSSAES